MYTKYFGLNEKPFAITPNPRYLYMSRLHKEALAHLLYGIESNGCFILLTGNIGTGKTTVCRCLLQQLPENADVAVILNPKLSVRDLLKAICEELAVDVDSQDMSVKNYIDALNIFLLKAHGRGRSTTLIIDEAQNLEIEVLEQLRLLTNLETDTHKLLQIILVGQPELLETLNNPALAQLNQRITSRYHLTPLRIDDVPTYIQYRITTAGGGQSMLFTKRALRIVEKCTAGTPRLINVLCDHALLGAYAENAPAVDHKIMQKAVKEVFQKKDCSLLSQKRVQIVFFLLAFAAASFFLFYTVKEELVIEKRDSTPGKESETTILPVEPVIGKEAVENQEPELPTFRAKLNKIKYFPPVDRKEKSFSELSPAGTGE